MEYESMKRILSDVASKNPSDIKPRDRGLITEIARELGVQINTNRRCKSCWVDAAVQCWSELKRKSAEEQSATDKRRYILVPDTDVIFGSIRVNEATLTDELAERIIARGFSKKYFVKC